jgi:hypothetical protein
MLRECGAKAKTNGHRPCRQPAMANGRCRLHGGLTRNTGAKTEEGKLRQKMSNWKHGLRSKETRDEKRLVREMIKKSKQLIAST